MIASDSIGFSTVSKDAVLRGYIREVSDEDEITRGQGPNHYRASRVFLTLSFYECNGQRLKDAYFNAKIFLTDEHLGRRNIQNGIIYYATNDLAHPEKEFGPTGITDPRKLLQMHIIVKGKMKKVDDMEGKFTHFMNHVQKIKILPDPKTYLKKNA